MQSAYLCQHVHSLHLWHCRAKGGARCSCLLFKMKTLLWCHLSMPSGRHSGRFRSEQHSSVGEMPQVCCPEVWPNSLKRLADQLEWTNLSVHSGAVASRGPYITPIFWLGLDGSKSFLLLRLQLLSSCTQCRLYLLCRYAAHSTLSRWFWEEDKNALRKGRGLNGISTCLD